MNVHPNPQPYPVGPRCRGAMIALWVSESLLRCADTLADVQQHIPINPEPGTPVGPRCRGAVIALWVNESLLRYAETLADARQHIPTWHEYLRTLKQGHQHMGHQETYQDNQDYAEFLSGWDASFYRKYTNTMVPDTKELPVLDVGCGVGQVVAELISHGVNAHGVDVSHPNIERARQHSEKCQFYDGKTLPYDDRFFGVVGAFNVLEHVEQPEAFLKELVRVVRPGGKVVVSSPNFFRVLGFRDYHPKMRGIGNKWINFKRLMTKRRILQGSFEHWQFDRMEPIVKEPFTPDDDAIIATNPMEIAGFLRHYGCRIESIACTDRVVHPLVDFCLNLGPWKYGMFNGFVVARR